MESAFPQDARVLFIERFIHDPDNEPQKVAAAVVSAPVAPVKSCTTEVTAGCPTPSIQSKSTFSTNVEVEEKAEVAHTEPTACGTVYILRRAEQDTVNAPFSVTCGTKQVQTILESTTFDPSFRTFLSVHLMLASDLTLENSKLDLASIPSVKRISLPLHYQKNGIRLFLCTLS